MITKTPRRPLGEGGVAGVARLRDALGRAHYERMREGMTPALYIAPWEDLSEGSREAYRRRTDYLVPSLVALLRDEPTEVAS